MSIGARLIFAKTIIPGRHGTCRYLTPAPSRYSPNRV